MFQDERKNTIMIDLSNAPEKLLNFISDADKEQCQSMAVSACFSYNNNNCYAVVEVYPDTNSITLTKGELVDIINKKFKNGTMKLENVPADTIQKYLQLIQQVNNDLMN